MAIDPKGADLKRLLNEDPGGPVVMLNLLRFASGKRDQYIRYVRELRPFAKKYRGRGLRGRRINPRGRRGWTGMGRGVARSLPDALGFLAHGGRPRVQKITQLRTTALIEVVLQATTPWTQEAVVSAGNHLIG